MTQTPKSRWYTLLHVTTYYCTHHNHWALYVLHITSILWRLHVVRAGDKGTISFGYCSCCSNGAHSYNHDLASADSGTSRGPWAGCLMYSVNSWSRDTRSAMKCPWCANSFITLLSQYNYIIIASLLRCYYILYYCSVITLLLHILTLVIITYYHNFIITLLLHIITSLLSHYYVLYYDSVIRLSLHTITLIVMTYYYKFIISYYYIIIYDYYMIITWLLPDYHVIITSLLQKGNHVIMIPLLRVMQRVCYHDYVVITYYYVIITKGPIITHDYIFQSPELADACPVNKRQSPKNGRH